MAFSQALPETFRVPLLNGSRDNDGRKESRIFINEVNVAQLFANHLVLFFVAREQLQSFTLTVAAQHCASLHSGII